MNPLALPLFPLQTVLFPGGLLPLQIFEVRYLDLMKRCWATGEPFGVVALRSGHEVRRAPKPGEPDAPAESLCEVGTLARLEVCEQVRPGLLRVVARGGERFALQSAQVLSHGLWQGVTTLCPVDQRVTVPDEHSDLRDELMRVMQAMSTDDDPCPPASHSCWQDCGWVANRWAERLPLPVIERQRLMTLDNPVWRLEMVGEWLARLRAQLDGQPPQA